MRSFVQPAAGKNSNPLENTAAEGGSVGVQSFDTRSALEIVKQYHELSQHRFGRYAPGPETLDWDNQPNPFRSFEGTNTIDLPLAGVQNPQDFTPLSASLPLPPRAINTQTVSALLRYALGLTAWKQYGPDQWSLRVNPSSGNLHPTEAYVLVGALSGEMVDDPESLALTPGLYHYNVEYHRLEKRADIASNPLPRQTLAIGLTSVMWRELWKYGERGFRYTQLDTGHAIAALAFSAQALGWQLEMVEGVAGQELSTLFGLNRPEYNSVEKEIAECLMWVGPDLSTTATSATLPRLTNWAGAPSKLGGRSFYHWPWAEKIAAATETSSAITTEKTAAFDRIPLLQARPTSLGLGSTRRVRDGNDVLFTTDAECAQESGSAEVTTATFQHLALTRRSAQAFDRSSINLTQFTELLNTLQRFSQPLFSQLCVSSNSHSKRHAVALAGSEAVAAEAEAEQELESLETAIDFVVMVHRVEGLTPGLYVMPSCAGHQLRLRAAVNKWSDWQAAIQIGDTSLYRVKEANVQKASATLCCQQAIAAEGACTIGFLSDFDTVLEQRGAAAYRQLHWQAGMLSQQLYMQASALNLAATGIGCFFDEPWHGLLGEGGTAMKMLYLTAVGKPVVDHRISSFSGYYHLAGKSAVQQPVTQTDIGKDS